MRDVLESTDPGWRPDPSGRYEWRYWDGGWTNRVANSARPGDRPDAAPADEHAAPTATPSDPADPSASSGGSTSPDPFAVLRDPSALESPAEPDTPPAPPEPLAPPVPLALAPVVQAHASSHDGTSETVWDAPFVPADLRSTPDADPPGAAPAASRRGIFAAFAGFIRSFWEQEESYHSANAGVQLPPHPKEQQLAPPANYARAGLVMLAAAGIAIGAYLPWISGHIGGTPYELTGYQLHDAWGFTLVAAAFALAAVLGARHRVMGWVTMALSIVVAGLVAKELLDVRDMVASLNAGPAADLDIGSGLWIMLAAAAIGLVAAFRLDTPAEIV